MLSNIKKIDSDSILLSLIVLSTLFWLFGIFIGLDENLLSKFLLSSISFSVILLNIEVIQYKHKLNSDIDEKFLIQGSIKIFKNYFIYLNKKIGYNEIVDIQIKDIKYYRSKFKNFEILLKLKNGERVFDNGRYLSGNITNEKRLKWEFLIFYLKNKNHRCNKISNFKKNIVKYLLIIHIIIYFAFLINSVLFPVLLIEIAINILISYYILESFHKIKRCFYLQKMLNLLNKK